MEIFFEDEVENKDNLSQYKNVFEQWFTLNLVKKFNIKSLLCIVVTSDSDEGFKKAFYKYAKGMKNEGKVSNDVFGKVLANITKKGKLNQIIFMKSGIFLALIYLIHNKKYLNLTEYAERLMLHEFGHVIDDETRHINGCYFYHPSKFNLKIEEKEFLLHQSLSLWSEYFAEKFSVENTGYKDDIKNREEELILYIKKCNSESVKFENIYDMLYRFIMYVVAFKETENIKSVYENFKDDICINQYLVILEKYERELSKLYENYPKFDIDINNENRDTREMENLYLDLCKMIINNKEGE